MDRIEAKEFLQAAALGCLDSNEINELRELLDFDSELQFELASYQTLCAMIPFSLDIVSPDEVVKDNIALRLKKIEEELRAQKEAELKSQMPEVKIEDTSEINQELQSVITEVDNLTDSLNTEPTVEAPPENLEILTPEVKEAQIDIPESYLGEDITKTEDIPDIPIEGEIFVDEEIKTETKLSSDEKIESDIVPEENFKEPFDEIKKTSSEQTEDIKFDTNESKDKIPVTETAERKKDKSEPAFSESRFSDITSRTVAEKLQKSFQIDLDSIRRALEKSQSKNFKAILSLIILSFILIAMIVFLFFKFSKDLKNLEKEIEILKRSSLQSKIIDSSDNYFFNQVYHLSGDLK